jgi:hypothetical protein
VVQGQVVLSASERFSLPRFFRQSWSSAARWARGEVGVIDSKV